MQLNPYLNFKGHCEEAFKSYEKSLKGNIEFLMRNGESPMADKTPPDQKNNVLHATLRFGDQVIMGADAPPEYYEKPQGFSISITVKEVQEAERIFNELSAGGSVRMPLQKTFWAQRFGMFTDRFDIPWMINCE
ncbi:MAG TPA: VOC family protein [Terriglobales bacterium]|jgi:PhnB protein|nr:VOC family protein [Terriglobales bacterium]